MKKYLFVFLCCVLVCGMARGATTCKVFYTMVNYACKPGYYRFTVNALNGTYRCQPCPNDASGNTATTPDYNEGTIKTCYISSGKTGKDASGSFKYTSDCPY